MLIRIAVARFAILEGQTAFLKMLIAGVGWVTVMEVS